jgi:MFS family permease
VRLRLGLPKPLVPIFWGLLFLEATYGAYLGVWPLWIERLGAPITVVGLVLGLTGVIRLIVLAPSAAIGERLGPRRAILIGRAATAVGLLTAAAATHWTYLAPMLIGAAMGEIAFPLLQSLVAAQAGDQRMRSFAVVFSVGPSIALIGAPLLSGAVVALWGMRAAFVLAAAFTVISMLFLARIQDPPAAPHGEHKVTSSYREAFADPSTRMIAILLFVTIFSLSLGTSLVPTFLEDVRGMDPAEITTIGAAAAVGSAAFGLAVARLHRLQRAPFVAVAAAIAMTAVGLVLFRFASAVPLIVLAFFCRGGLFASWAMLSAALGELAPARHRTRAFALCEMVGGFAISLGPVVAAPLYSVRASLPFEVAIVLALMLVPALLLAQRRADRLAQTASVADFAPATVEPDASGIPSAERESA